MESEISLGSNTFDIFGLYSGQMSVVETGNKFDYVQQLATGLEAKDREYFALYFRAAAEKRLYVQEKYDLLSYLGDLGGLFDILYMIGLALTSFYSSKLFIAAIINQAYKV